MRITSVLAFAAIIVTTGVHGDEPKDGQAGKRGPLEGAWQLVESKSGDNDTDAMVPKHKSLKILSADHFTWVTYNGETKEPEVVGGGTYSFKDGVYQEKYLFASKIVAPLLRKEHIFESKLDGDRWHHSGVLDGAKFKQVWERVK